VREKLQKDKRDKNDKSGKRSKPPKQLPLVPPRTLGPPQKPPNFLTKQEVEPERVNMDKLLSNLQKSGVLGASGPIIFGEEVSLPSEYTALDEKRARLNAWANANKGKVKQGPAAQPTSSSSPLPTTSDALEDILTRIKDYSLATNDDILTNYRPSQNNYKDLRQVITYFRSGKLCPNTGIRFPKDQEKRYHSHLDWYFLQNKQKEQEKYRPWYLEAGNWLSYNELNQKEKSSPEVSVEKPKRKRIDEDFAAETFNKKPAKISVPDPDDDVPFVPDTPTPVSAKTKRALEPERPITVTELNMLEDQCCAISGEPFQTQYDEDTEEWLVKDCVIKNGKAYNKNNLDDRELKLDKSIIYDEEDSTPSTPKPPKKKIQKLAPQSDSNMSIDKQGSVELPSPEFKLPQAPLISTLSPKPVENAVEQKSMESINPESISMSEMDLEADDEVVQIVENGERLARRESVARLEEDAPMPRTPSPVASEHNSINELKSPGSGNMSLGLNISAFPMPVIEEVVQS